MLCDTQQIGEEQGVGQLDLIILSTQDVDGCSDIAKTEQIVSSGSLRTDASVGQGCINGGRRWDAEQVRSEGGQPVVDAQGLKRMLAAASLASQQGTTPLLANLAVGKSVPDEMDENVQRELERGIRSANVDANLRQVTQFGT